MKKLSIKEIKEISSNERYYPYETWIDHIFSPLSPYLAWFCIRLKISGNGVSWISGAAAILGGILLANSDPILIFIGSFGYIIFYQLDYVDGSVARFNKKAGIGGQYVDFIIHVISHVSIIAGIAFGAVMHSGSHIIPFAILAITAAALAQARHSTAWFAIVMEQQKRKSKGLDILQEEPIRTKYKEPNFLYEFTRKLTVLFLHEGHLIFFLPLLAFLQTFIFNDLIDFRVLITLFAGLIYFPISVFEIQRLVNRNGVDEAYWDLFNPDSIPNIPDDHFFRAREK
tara:strand:+ start:4053 stop:4907 length:855 start_codon:yes stop_codon:yes gene_type:complete